MEECTSDLTTEPPNHSSHGKTKTSMFAGSSSSASSFPEGLKRTHGALNLFAWGVLLPIGAIVARYCRRWDPLWFYLHTGIQFVGFILGLAGIVAGVSLYNKIQANVPAHRGLGIFVLVLGILQVCAFCFCIGETMSCISSQNSLIQNTDSS
jgi:hypothetical protein